MACASFFIDEGWWQRTLTFSKLLPSKLKQLRGMWGKRKCVRWGRRTRERKECFPLNIWEWVNYYICWNIVIFNWLLKLLAWSLPGMYKWRQLKWAVRERRGLQRCSWLLGPEKFKMPTATLQVILPHLRTTRLLPLLQLFTLIAY